LAPAPAAGGKASVLTPAVRRRAGGAPPSVPPVPVGEGGASLVGPPRKRRAGRGLLVVSAVIVFLIVGCFLGLAIIGKLQESGGLVAVPGFTQAPATQGQGAPPAFECHDDLGCVTVPANEPIHIAAALVISGPNESLGLDSLHGIEIAIDDRGPVAGHGIHLTTEDTGCSAEGGQAAATRLAADRSIVAVIGTSCSSEARVAVPLLSQTGWWWFPPLTRLPT